ncbi:hypothetical protein [Actinomycetospora flava]|uniref:Uncharacterized protein n=1 Tax=Actinomycetospora flava TaxID=3129232 RepID=A0ABU8M8C4_9PSEU
MSDDHALPLLVISTGVLAMAGPTPLPVLRLAVMAAVAPAPRARAAIPTRQPTPS